MHERRRSTLRGLGTLGLLLTAAGCAAASGTATLTGSSGEMGFSASSDGRIHRFFIDGSVEAVWFQMQHVFPALHIPVADQQLRPERGWIVSRRMPFPAADFHCGTGPSGEQPVSVSVQGVLTATLEEVGVSRTQVTFTFDVEGRTVEPDFTSRRVPCVSRGTLEQRIVQRTEQRLVGTAAEMRVAENE